MNTGTEKTLIIQSSFMHVMLGLILRLPSSLSDSLMEAIATGDQIKILILYAEQVHETVCRLKSLRRTVLLSPLFIRRKLADLSALFCCPASFLPKLLLSASYKGTSVCRWRRGEDDKSTFPHPCFPDRCFILLHGTGGLGSYSYHMLSYE